jgi:HAD superfamily hydrolase (TIGR01549 family)
LQKLGRDNFFPKLTREFDLPVKPNPACSFYICEKWGVPTDEVIFVGDFRDDMTCGKMIKIF